MQTQGARANKNGKVLENLVVGTLSQYGFQTLQNKDLVKSKQSMPDEVLIQNAPYTTLYGSKGKTEFLLHSKYYNLNVRIECKWQQSAGSVDEKLPHLYLSSIFAMPEDDVILLVDGDGFRNGAIAWLRNVISQREFIPEHMPNKNIRMMDTREFITWANQTF